MFPVLSDISLLLVQSNVNNFYNLHADVHCEMSIDLVGDNFIKYAELS